MAFSPFTWFRKHQKVFFAGLTILCMFVFIGQFGSGDAFSRLLGLFGRGRHGEAVATLYDSGVTRPKLEALAKQRKVANDFMFDAAWKSHEKALKTLL